MEGTKNVSPTFINYIEQSRETEEGQLNQKLAQGTEGSRYSGRWGPTIEMKITTISAEQAFLFSRINIMYKICGYNFFEQIILVTFQFFAPQ